MSQLSRPFQLVLLVFGVLALVWLFVLQGHPANTSTSPATSVVSAPAPTASSEAKAAAAPTNVYHGAAPGVEGLTHAIAQAHKAVATSQQSAAAIEHKSAAASGSTSTNSSQGTSSATTPAKAGTPAAHAVAPTSATRVHHSATPAKQTTTPTKQTIKPKSRTHPGAAVPAGQRTVERQLSQGNVVALLFWNRQSPSDTAVRDELQLLLKVHQHSQSYANQPKVKRLLTDFSPGIHRTIAVDEATAKQVAEYGAITRGVQLYNTPTLLIITKTGKTLVLTGLQDAYSIEQAIDEARNA
jgi:hypothetical protein